MRARQWAKECGRLQVSHIDTDVIGKLHVAGTEMRLSSKKTAAATRDY